MKRVAIIQPHCLLLVALWLLVSGCQEPPVELGETSYSDISLENACDPGSRPGKTGLINDQSSSDGINYNVRTPTNYDATFKHPLLVIYSPAGRRRSATERFTGLTKDATTKGFIIAYVDHQPMSKDTLLKLSKIPGIIAKKWCVDLQRIYLSGHSDGGSVAMGLAFLPETATIASAIAPSGAGLRGSDLAEYSCPKPTPVMVLHSTDDSLFPGFGAETAAWWANCNQCDSHPEKPLKNGCMVYFNCANHVKTWYCEGQGSHASWPNINSVILKFFGSPFDASGNNK